MSRVKAELEVNTQQAGKDIENITGKVKDAGKEVDKTSEKFANFGKSISSALSSTAIIGFVSSLKKGLDIMIKLTKPQAEYVESMNLLQVAYEDNTKSADKLIKSMNQLIGLDPSNLVRQLGVYRQFSSAMGITGDSANMLSENLLKLQTDISSLYNLDFEVAGKKLQSAIAGQTRPVRELGADITEASLQQELYNRGIDASVKEMNRASKSVLIYLALERQLSNANGDASKTVNSLANQMRIFKEQVTMAARQVGAIFIPVLRSILPIANAILMVFNELMNMLLSLLGVDASDMAKEFGIGTSSVLDMTDQVDNLGSSIGGATQKAKELKLSLRGFDKLNNITTPTEPTSSGGGGGGIGGALSGVDSRLLDALKEYDLHLDSISNKAAQIRDDIMEWLGFSRDANGEWKFQEVTLGTVIGLLAGGAGVLWAGSKILGVVGSIGEFIGGFLTKIPMLSGMLEGMSGLQIFALVAGVATSIYGIISTFDRIAEFIVDPSWENFESILGSISIALAGIGVAILAFNLSNPIGWIALLVGALGGLIFEYRNDERALKDVKQAQDDLLESQRKYAEQSKTHLNAYKQKEEAEKQLTKTAKDLGKSEEYVKETGYNLYKDIAEGRKTLDDLKGDNLKIYDTYINLVDANERYEKSNRDLQEAYKQTQRDTLDLQATNLKTKKSFEEYGETISKALNSGAITSEEAGSRIYAVLDQMDEKVRQSFVDSLPYNVKTGMLAFKKELDGTFNGLTDKLPNVEIKFNTNTKVFEGNMNSAIQRIQKNLNSLKAPTFKVDNNGQYVTVKTRMGGGFVETGEMFIANENGIPEMIGKIGNQPAVANNNQIIEGISIGVKRAMESVRQPNQPIVVKADANTSGLLNFINFEQEKRNRQYGL